MRIHNPQTGEVMIRQGDDWVPVKNPTVAHEMSPVDAMVTGAGYEFDRIGAGIKNIFGGDVEAQQAQAAQDMQPLKQIHPGSTAFGQALPYLATAPISATSLPAQVALGAVAGGLPYSQNQAAGAGIGAGLGATGWLGQRMFSRVANAITGKGSEIAERTAKAGLKASPAQMTGSQGQLRTEAAIEALPFGEKITGRAAEHNQNVINRLALEAIGEPAADKFGKQSLDKAAQRIGGVFDEVTDFADTVPLDEGLMIGMLDDISPDSERVISKWMKNYPDIDQGSIASKDLVNLRNKVSERIRNAYRKGDYDMGDDLTQFQDVLEDGIAKVAPADYAERLGQARQQWKQLKAIERGKNLKPTGDVSPAGLDSSLRSIDKVGYLRGRDQSPYYESLRLAGELPKFQDSGTATRSLLTGAGLAGMGGASGYSVEDAGAGAASALAIPYLLAGAYRGAPGAAGLLGKMSPVLARTGAGLLSDELE